MIQLWPLLLKELKRKKNSILYTILSELMALPLFIVIIITLIICKFKSAKLPLDLQNYAINQINGGIGFMSKFWGSNTEFECSEEYLTPNQIYNKYSPEYYNPLKLCEISNNPIFGFIGDYSNFQNFWTKELTTLFITYQRKPYCDRYSDRGFDFKIENFTNMNEFDNYIKDPAYKIDQSKSDIRDGVCIGMEVNKTNNIYNITIRYGEDFSRRNFFTDSDLELYSTTKFFSDNFHNDILSLTTFTQLVEGGFIYLQSIMTDFLISSTEKFQNHSTFVFLIPIIDSNKQINYPVYKKMKTILQYFMGIGFYLVFARICISISEEKGSKLRGIMILKGMSYYLYWVSMIIEYILFSLLISIIFSLISTFFIFPNTNYTYIFFMFLLHYMNQLSLAVFCSSFFSSEEIVLIFGTSIYFVNFLLGILFASFNFSDWILFGFSILPPIGGISLISKMINTEILIEEMRNLNAGDDASLSNTFIPLFLIMHILSFCILLILGILLDYARMYGLIERPNWKSQNKIGIRVGDDNDVDTRKDLFTIDIPIFSILDDEPQKVSEGLKPNKSKDNEQEPGKEDPLIKNSSIEVHKFDNNKLHDEILNEKNRRENLKQKIKLQKGSVFAILGANGSGKTKLIELISGLYGPINQTSNRRNLLQLLQESNEKNFSIGFNSNREVFASLLTVRELLEFYSALSSTTNENEGDVKIDKILETCGLSDFENTMPHKLSKGQKTALSVAIALVGNSYIILLDNPTLEMDPIIKESLINYLREIKGSKIIFLATNSMDEAELLGDKFALLDNGKFYLLESLSSMKYRHVQYILSFESNDAFKYNTITKRRTIENENYSKEKNDASPGEEGGGSETQRNLNGNAEGTKIIIDDKNISKIPEIQREEKKDNGNKPPSSEIEDMNIINSNNIDQANEDKKKNENNGANLPLHESLIISNASVTENKNNEREKPNIIKHNYILNQNEQKIPEGGADNMIESIDVRPINNPPKTNYYDPQHEFLQSKEEKKNQTFTFENIQDKEEKAIKYSVRKDETLNNFNNDCLKEDPNKINTYSNEQTVEINAESLFTEIKNLIQKDEYVGNISDQNKKKYDSNLISLLSVTPRLCKIRIPIENLTHDKCLFFKKLPEILKKYHLNAFELSRQTLDDIYLYIQFLISMKNKKKYKYLKKINCTNFEKENSDKKHKKSIKQERKKSAFFTQFNCVSYFSEMVKKYFLTFYYSLFLFLLICFFSLFMGMIVINASTKSVAFEYSEPIQPIYYNYSANPQLFYYTAPPTNPSTNCDNNSTLLALELANFLKINSNINLVPYPDFNLNPDLEDHIYKFISYFQSDSKKMNSYVNGSLLTSFLKIPSTANDFQITCSNNLFIFVNLSNPNSTGLVTSHIFDSLLRFTTNDNARIFFTNYPLPLSSYSKEIMKSKLALIPVFFLVFSLSALNFIFLYPFSKEVTSGLARMQKLYGGSPAFWISNSIIHAIFSICINLGIFCMILTIFGYRIVYLYEITTLYSVSIIPFSYLMILIFTKYSCSISPEIIVLLLNIFLGNSAPFIIQLLQRFVELKKGLEIIEYIFMFLFPPFTFHQGLYHSLEKTSESIYIFPFYSKSQMDFKIKLAFGGLASSLVIYSILIVIIEHFFDSFNFKSNPIRKIINIRLKNCNELNSEILNIKRNKINNSPFLDQSNNNSNRHQNLHKNCTFRFIHDNILIYFGQNSSGKTEIINLLCYGFHSQTIDINNKDFLIHKHKKLNFILIGYSPSGFSIFPNLTVYNYLYFFLVMLLNKIPSEYLELVDILLKKFNLKDYKDKRISELSDGIIKKLKIAISFIPKQSLILIDGLSSEIDHFEKIYFWYLIKKRSQKNKSKIIITSSQINDLILFSNLNHLAIAKEGMHTNSKLFFKIQKNFTNYNFFKIQFQLQYSDEKLSDYLIKNNIEDDETERITYTNCKEFWEKKFDMLTLINKECVFELLKKTFHFQVESDIEPLEILAKSYYQKFFYLIQGFDLIEQFWKKCIFKIKEKPDNLFQFTVLTSMENIIEISSILLLVHPQTIELIKICILRNLAYESSLKEKLK